MNGASSNVAAVTVDSGGGLSASVHYSQRTSIGTYGGVAAAAAPPVTARQGFIGQFFDVTGLVLSTASTNLSEGALQQLDATAQLDDGTFLAASARAVWAVLSGPISSVSASGVASGGVVYQNSPATVRAQYQGFQATLALAVLDINPDNFGLYSGDGLPDLWQVQHFGTDNPLAGPMLDPDGDSHDNRFEYTAGLDPKDALSFFRLTVSEIPNSPDEWDVTFSPRLTDRGYDLEFTLDIASGGYIPVTGATTNDVGLTRTVTHYFGLGETRIYRVRISKP